MLMIILEIIHYRMMIREINIEVFAGIIGVLFLGLGIWLGSRIYQGRPKESYDPKKLGLSKREIEVLELIAECFSNQEIADQLFVSLNTTKTHISNIYSKLNVKRRTQAIQKARDLAIVNPVKE